MIQEQVFHRVHSRLAILREQLEKYELEVRALQSKLPLIRAKIEENEMFLSDLGSLDEPSEADDVESSEIEKIVDSTSNEHVNGQSIRGETTRTVMRFLAQCDEAVRPVEVVNAVADQLDTTAKDPRRLVFNTLYNLAKAGKIEKTPTGRVRIRRP